MKKMQIFNFVLLVIIFYPYSLFADVYEGRAIPILNCIIKAGTNFPYMGNVKKVPRTGQIATPSVIGADGEIIDEGTILIQSDLTYHEAMVKKTKDELKQFIADLKTNREIYKRDLSLSSEKADSTTQYDNQVAVYCSDEGNVLSAKGAYIDAEAVLTALTQRAKFEAVVDKVFRAVGILMSEHEILELSQLNPMGVEVEMSREKATKIKPQTNVRISTYNDEPLDILMGLGYMTEKGYRFVVYNRPVFGEFKEINGGKIRTVKDISTVLEFNTLEESSPLCVDIYSIFNDDIGAYIWKAEGVKNAMPGKGIDNPFKLKKVYIKLLDIKKNYGGFTMYHAIDENDELSVNDVIVKDVPQKTKSGDTVVFVTDSYFLMPNDPVKVVIDN